MLKTRFFLDVKLLGKVMLRCFKLSGMLYRRDFERDGERSVAYAVAIHRITGLSKLNSCENPLI